MKDKGIGAIVVVAVVVVGAAAAAGGYFIISRRGGAGGIPTPSGFTSYNYQIPSQSLPEGVEATTYMSTGDMTSQEATATFVSSLEDAGWSSTAQTKTVGSYSGTYLEKGNQAAVIWSMTIPQGNTQSTITIVATGPKSEVSGETEEGESETGGETGEETGGAIVDWATSVDFTLTKTFSDSGEFYAEFRTRARNLDTSTPDIRIDMAETSSKITENYILLGSEEKGWIQAERLVLDEWTRFSKVSSEDFSSKYSESLDALKSRLNPPNDTHYTTLQEIEESGIQWTNETMGITYNFHDIEINPSIPNSVFGPTEETGETEGTGETVVYDDDAGKGEDAPDFSGGISISTGSTLSGGISEEESDYTDRYKFSASDGNTIEISLNETTDTGELYITLYDPADEYAKSTISEPKKNQTLTYTADSSGDWFFKVSLVSEATSKKASYTFNIGVSG